jgi:hypothetical protein
MLAGAERRLYTDFIRPKTASAPAEAVFFTTTFFDVE